MRFDKLSYSLPTMLVQLRKTEAEIIVVYMTPQPSAGGSLAEVVRGAPGFRSLLSTPINTPTILSFLLLSARKSLVCLQFKQSHNSLVVGSMSIS